MLLSGKKDCKAQNRHYGLMMTFDLYASKDNSQGGWVINQGALQIGVFCCKLKNMATKFRKKKIQAVQLKFCRLRTGNELNCKKLEKPDNGVGQIIARSCVVANGLLINKVYSFNSTTTLSHS